MVKYNALTKMATIALVLIVVLSVVTGVYVYNLTTSQGMKEKIVIGLSLPINHLVGIHVKNAVEMALEEINSAGGIRINGSSYQLTYVVEDTNELDPMIPVDHGVTAFKRITEIHKAHAVIGGFRTEVTVAQTQLLSQYKVVFLDIFSNTRILEDRVIEDYENYKYYFHVFAGGRNSSVGPYLVSFLTALKNTAAGSPNYPDTTKISLLAENAIWTVALAGRPAGNSSFFQILKRQGLELVYADLYPLGQSDFSSYLARVRSSGAGLIIFLFSGPPGVAFIKQWDAFSWEPGKKPIVFGVSMLGGISWFWKQTDGSADTTVWWPATVKVPVSPKTVQFTEKFVQKYGETPATAALNAYDAVYILKDALEKAGTWKVDRLVAALEQTDYEGVIGRIQYSKQQHGLDLRNKSIYGYFGQWQNGELVPVWSPEKTNEVVQFKLPRTR